MSRALPRHARTFTQTELAAALSAVLRIGVLVLRSGAASFRTQEVMARCAAALGIEQLEAYVTPTGIIASASSGGEHRTQIRQVRG
ncbi:MAG: threonine/serine exporter family protein, partial [Aggregatilineales bacterium]